MLLTFLFCVSKCKGMTTKKPEEATLYLRLGIPLIQIHFEIRFVSLTDSIKHFEFVFFQSFRFK